ncbi:MAG: IclR family transcriptional regulator [Alicyclobacillus sp.]|nr:IclR family transcriptional regulator [Alicyclobacillus sp.]
MSAIEQAALILKVLSERKQWVSFRDLVLFTELPKSSLHSVLERLVKVGWVERTDGSMFRIGIGLVEISRNWLNDMDIVRRFTEVCDNWRSLDAGTIVLSMLDGTDALYLAYRNGNSPIGVQYKIGMRLPAATTASGKAALSQCSDDQVRDLYSSSTVLSNGLCSKTVEDLLNELKQIRECGYSIDDEETAVGMICFGAPIKGLTGESAPCAVAISLMKAVVSTRDYGRYIQEVLDLQEALNLRKRT